MARSGLARFTLGFRSIAGTRSWPDEFLSDDDLPFLVYVAVHGRTQFTQYEFANPIVIYLVSGSGLSAGTPK